MGPLVSEEQFQRVTGYIESGLKEGAKIAAGGKKVGTDGGYFVEPTVLTNTQPSMKVVREEIFGPVVCAEPFDDTDLERIAKKANATIYGLAASVWTRDISKAHKLAGLIRSGTVWINCHNVFDASLPFGGFKQSGWGREMGDEVLHNYTEVKSVTARSSEGPLGCAAGGAPPDLAVSGRFSTNCNRRERSRLPAGTCTTCWHSRHESA